MGRGWSALAAAALPDDVPAFREAKELNVRKAALTRNPGATSAEEIRAVWQRLGELGKEAREKFPLTSGECAELRLRLHSQICSLYEAEVAAHAAMGELCP